MDTLNIVAKKIAAGQRLSEEDAVGLFESAELVEIGRLADEVNRRKNNDVVYYNVNRHINPTNICALSCKFCAYSRKPGEDGAYAYSTEEMVTKATEAVAQGATEVHMVGGLHPRWRFETYKEMIAAVKTAHPSLHIKAFTAVELDWFARRARKTITQVLEELQAVGLGSLPGGGAEIFAPEVRDVICDTKVSAEQWIDTHRTAHGLGMHSNCTMLYGHIESYANRVDHMARLRALQDETGGFNAFIPLAFQPFQNEMGIDRYTFGYDDLKTLAIARLFLDNFRHIKAYWIMLGQDIAQLALQFGANDLDGTIIEEKISRMAGGRAGMGLSRSFLENLILKGKRVPCERDTLYHPVPRPTSLRAPRQGATAQSQSDLDKVRGLLNKEVYGAALVPEELLVLAQHAGIHDLGRLAGEVITGHVGDASFSPTVAIPMESVSRVSDLISKINDAFAASRTAYGLTPTSIALDVARPADQSPAVPAPSLDLLVEAFWALKHSFPGSVLEVRGLKGLWTMAQDESVKMVSLLAQLKEAGADGVESSPRESETDVTNAEILGLHRQVRAAGLTMIAKVELTAPTHGAGEPLWEAFLRRVHAFGEAGGLLGLSVEASPGSFVTSSEYVRAVALTRLAARSVPLIIAPLPLIPTLSPPTGLGTAKFQHPAEKLAALCCHYGANDLGAIDVASLNPVAVMKQIRAAGFRPVMRERHASATSPAWLKDQELRHMPSLGHG